MRLREEIKALKKLKFDEIKRGHYKISIRLKLNQETILKTVIAIENAILLFGNYEVKLTEFVILGGSPSIELTLLVPESDTSILTDSEEA